MRVESRHTHTVMHSLMMILAQTSLVMATPMAHAVGASVSAVNASQPLDGFISYSIEFSSFPDFAGKELQPHDRSA